MDTHENMRMIAEVADEKNQRLQYFFKVALLIIIVLLLAFYFRTTTDVGFVFIFQSVLGILGIGFLIVSLFFPRTVIMNKDHDSIAVVWGLLNYWKITTQAETLTSFYGVRIRVLPRRGNPILRVELVGVKGSTLLLRNQIALNDARDLRDSIADWLEVSVMYDPAYPNYR